MFRLTEAVRRYRAQHHFPTELRCVATTVTTLPPRANPDTAGVVASVVAVATPTSKSIDLVRLIEQLREEGLCCNTAKVPSSSAQHTGGSWTSSAPTGKPCCSFYKQLQAVKKMALLGRRDGRNFGYGRQLSYAGRQALEDLFAGGHFATVKAHSDRWQAFVRWCRSEDGPGYNDARQIDRQRLNDYAAYLRCQVQQEELCIATAQNRLSSVNRTLQALRGDQDVKSLVRARRWAVCVQPYASPNRTARAHYNCRA